MSAVLPTSLVGQPTRHSPIARRPWPPPRSSAARRRGRCHQVVACHARLRARACPRTPLRAAAGLLRVDIVHWDVVWTRLGTKKSAALVGELGAHLVKSSRIVDIVAYHGKGIFSLLLPDTPGVGALVVAQRIVKFKSAHPSVKIRVGVAPHTATAPSTICSSRPSGRRHRGAPGQPYAVCGVEGVPAEAPERPQRPQRPAPAGTIRTVGPAGAAGPPDAAGDARLLTRSPLPGSQLPPVGGRRASAEPSTPSISSIAPVQSGPERGRCCWSGGRVSGRRSTGRAPGARCRTGAWRR